MEQQQVLNHQLENQLVKRKEQQKDQYNGLPDKMRDELTLLDGQLRDKKELLQQEQKLTKELEERAVDMKSNPLLQEMLQSKVQCDQALKDYNQVQAQLDHFYSFDRPFY